VPLVVDAAFTTSRRKGHAVADMPHAPRPYADSGDWSSATPVRAGSPRQTGQRGTAGRSAARPTTRRPPPRVDVAFDEPGAGAAQPDTRDGRTYGHAEITRRPERGLSSWAALLVLLVIAGIGGLIDTISGAQVRGGFNYGIVIASAVAILLVRRSGMFPVVIAPPIVYSGASAAMLYIRSSGLHDRKVLFDAAANWLVYGFPAIASASAVVLIVAGVRMIIRR
jgi:hypothetical protein